MAQDQGENVIRKLFVIVACSSLILIPVGQARAATTIHVAPGGSDSNGGTSLQDALRSIQEGVDRADPGDVVLVAPGTYEGSVDIERSGQAGAWITVRSSTRHAAKVVIPSGFEYEYGFRMAANYVQVEGFEILHEDVGPDHWGAGITVDESHHNRVVGNHIHDVGGNGIEFYRCDYMTVEGNVVHDAAHWAPNQTSGITLYQARAVDSAEGIHNVVRGNVSFRNRNLVLDGDETTDGNGIIIDDFRNDHDSGFNVQYPHDTLIENNLVFDNGGKGIHIFQSNHVLARNNTAYHNNTDTQNPATWRGELNVNEGADITWVNNIAVANPGSGVLSNNTAFLIGRAEDVSIVSNLTAGPNGGSTIAIDGDGQIATMSGNQVGANPRFANPSTDPQLGDFTLTAGSPAIDAGTDAYGLPTVDITGQDRVLGGRVDLGAYEFGNPPPTDGAGIPPGGILPVFVDIGGSPFAADILWLAEQRITLGCNPPANDRFCPNDSVSRGQMAAFLGRALELDAAPRSVGFVDDDDSVFEQDIEALAAAGITQGCNPPANDRFCPGDAVTRGQMAAFLTRALDLTANGSARFVDDNGSVFEQDIERLAAAGITLGCNPPTNDRFCPGDSVTRGQMAAFLHRGLGS